MSEEENPTTQTQPKFDTIHQAIAEVTRRVGEQGVAKGQKATFGAGYLYRGINDYQAALNPIMAQVGLAIVPHEIVECSIEEVRSGNSKTEWRVTTRIDYMICYDGETMKASSVGCAIDMREKAYGQAQTDAMKSLLQHLFMIPTAGQVDTEQNNEPVRSAPEPQPEWIETAKRIKKNDPALEDELRTTLQETGLLTENGGLNRNIQDNSTEVYAFYDWVDERAPESKKE